MQCSGWHGIFTERKKNMLHHQDSCTGFKEVGRLALCLFIQYALNLSEIDSKVIEKAASSKQQLLYIMYFGSRTERR